ncbi:hypothetical protein [Streptomyces sp. AA1529]|uniref:hypothetical protein n=1 Tax=Streptomyces sp. AA1529 TaxID=1203257 RepID=UPI0002E9BD89|nr:hypothetical protein [Streptomyces sp. AA1529]
MYGPAASQPPQPPRQPQPGAARPGGTRALLVRIAFASFPLWSLGLLAWVPSLRFAILRRRPLDWAVFAGACVLTAVYILLLFVVPETKPGEEGNAQLGAGVYIVLLIGGAVVHALLADRGPRTPRFAPAPTLYAPAAGPYAAPAQPAAPAAPYGGAAPYAPTVSAPPNPHQAPNSQQEPHQNVYPGSVPPASPRMRQVASELDELGELLRRNQSGAGAGGSGAGSPGAEHRPGSRDPRQQSGPWDRA